MEYTTEMYEEDLNIATIVYAKRFKNYTNFKEDLIQTALLNLWRVRSCFDETKVKYFTYAYKVAFNSMYRFIKGQSKHFGKLSIFETYGETPLIDQLKDNDGVPLAFDYDYLLQVSNEIINNHKSKALKKIASLSLQCKKPAQIAKELNISRQAATEYVKRFRILLTEKLKQENYF